jgi:hypothetical protein
MIPFHIQIFKKEKEKSSVFQQKQVMLA